MKKCIVIGKFATDKSVLDGQTVKCSNIYNELCTKFGESEISYYDTYEWKKHPFKLLAKSVKALKQYKNIIILPAHNGIKVFAPLFAVLNKRYNKKLHYIVIGSWLFDKIKTSNILRKSLKKFDSIFVETSKLKNDLESIGYKNVSILKNYKKLRVIGEGEIVPFKEKDIMKLCMFSRVNKEKGINDAINVLTELNEEKEIFELDIYGMIDKQYDLEFKDKIDKSKNFVKYCGIIDADKSVETIKKYDLLLFPTKYLTEGIPGTIIDSYAAGVPVLASAWENYKDVIDEDKTGIVFKFNNLNDFKSKLMSLYMEQNKIYNMKFNCINKASMFCSENVLQPLFEALEEQKNENAETL